MFSSPYYVALEPKCLRVSLDEMRIDVIRYKTLTLFLRHYGILCLLCPTVSLIFTAKNVVS